MIYGYCRWKLQARVPVELVSEECKLSAQTDQDLAKREELTSLGRLDQVHMGTV